MGGFNHSPPFIFRPNGKGGGKKGLIRGQVSEEIVAGALRWLKAKGMILSFRKEDSKGKDFVVLVENGCGIIHYRIEVKSSYGEARRYINKRKKSKFMADMVIIPRDADTIFSLSNLIESRLGLA
jgi:hypothetical protein